jgi:phosphoenolpyruvate carboxylase
VAEAIDIAREHGLSESEVQSFLHRLSIELVFIAHPTEAKRRSVRAKIRSLRRVLASLGNERLLPRECACWRSFPTEHTTAGRSFWPT